MLRGLIQPETYQFFILNLELSALKIYMSNLHKILPSRVVILPIHNVR
jgi:hypothetical protein